MTHILVATSDGLHTIGDRAGVDLAGRDVTALARGRAGWWAIVDEGVVLRGAPGAVWEEVAVADTRLTCLVVSSHGVFCGTADARLLHLLDGRLEAVEAFDDVAGRDAWYTPWGGPPATRSLSCHSDGTLYVNIHVGGIVRSGDGGRTWEPTLDIDLDVHEVRVEAPTGWVVAATGAGGFALSEDGGDSWWLTDEGLHGGYCRAVAVAGAAVLLSASTGPRTHRGGVYRRALEGDGPFERCRQGLPEWFEGNVDTGWLDAAGDLVALAAPAGSGEPPQTAGGRATSGELYLSDDAGGTWQLVAEDLPPVRTVAVEPI
ncbi:MAG: hypothetical protein M3N32_11875 [Actinomycetota bacterium]|nr:hypothetical protein [Actinomycetota bacterium]